MLQMNQKKLMKYHKIILSTLTLLTVLSLTKCATRQSADQQSKDVQEVTIYTQRHYPADEKILQQFTQQTGIKVNVFFASAAQLIQRLKLEGKNSKADLLITVDGSMLYTAVKNKLLQPVQSSILDKNIPKKFRHPQNYCFALTYRGRVIIYSKDRVNPKNLSTYQALTTPEWEEKVLVRSSSNTYNQSLLASLIALDGVSKAKGWAEGMLNNFARTPKGNDRDQIRAVAAGIGDLAIANTYYLGLMLNASDSIQRNVAKKVRIFFPNQGDTEEGVHINISGAGITKYAPNKSNAIKLLEFLSSKTIQEKFASTNYEYPVNIRAKWHQMLKSWGTFKTQNINFFTLGKYHEQAKDIFNEVGWP